MTERSCSNCVHAAPGSGSQQPACRLTHEYEHNVLRDGRHCDETLSRWAAKPTVLQAVVKFIGGRK